MKENVLMKYFGGVESFNTPSRLILVALSEFGEKPPSLVSVSDITQKAKCNVSAVSYYFGGKNELYAELVNQIIEYLRSIERPFWDRLEALKKSVSASQAREILRDYFRWRMQVTPMSGPMQKSIFSLIAREEVYEGEFFSLIYERFMKDHNAFMSGAIEMASGGKVAGESAKIAAMAFVSQIIRFTASKEYLKLNMNWDSLDDGKMHRICDTLLVFLDKVLA